jgi:putative DNA primase/helicase
MDFTAFGDFQPGTGMRKNYSADVPRRRCSQAVARQQCDRVRYIQGCGKMVAHADTFLKDNECLRGVIDSGHNKANAYILRNVGDNYEPKQFRTWSPKAIALIGRMHPTLISRCVHIEMRRKGLGEKVAELRPDRLGHLHILAQKAARWASDSMDALRAAEPNIPASLSGRRADNWRHMLAIADAAGGSWPERARKAAEAMVADDDNEVAGILLLQDVHTYFETHKATDRVTSSDLAKVLHEMLERPWPEWGKNGKPITETQIAKLLRNFKVKSRTIRQDAGRSRGYLAEQFKDAFACYLPTKTELSPPKCYPVTM